MVRHHSLGPTYSVPLHEAGELREKLGLLPKGALTSGRPSTEVGWNQGKSGREQTSQICFSPMLWTQDDTGPLNVTESNRRNHRDLESKIGSHTFPWSHALCRG